MRAPTFMKKKETVMVLKRKRKRGTEKTEMILNDFDAMLLDLLLLFYAVRKFLISSHG
jgi:hypothetical protein